MEAAFSGFAKLAMSQQTNINISAASGSFRSLSSINSSESRDVSGKRSLPAGESLPVLAPSAKPDLEKIVQKLNAASVSIGRDLRFQVDVHSGKSVIQVLDSETGEIIRQIPAEKVSSYLQAQGRLAIRLLDYRA